jgi:hypothetical protein
MNVKDIRNLWATLPAHLRFKLALAWADAGCAGDLMDFVDAWGLGDL